MKKALFAALLLGLTACVYAQAPQQPPTGFDLSNFGVRIEPDKRVMIVLATLEAARTNGDAGDSAPIINTPLSAEGVKFRELLRSDLAAMSPDLRARISSFVLQYKKRNPEKADAELVAPFISMAYALGPVPDLADPVVTADLPGSLLDVLDFAPLVRDFYRRSSMAGNIGEYVKSYQKTSDGQLRTSAREMVNELLSYLHTRPQVYYDERIRTETQKSGSKRTTLTKTETRSRERRFFIVPEMLAPTGTVTFVNVKDDYYVVVPADADLTFSEVRRGFLQFVVDPIVIANARDIATIRDSVKALLDERRKTDPKLSPDVYLTISRSLVAAIDAKQSEDLRIKIATEQTRAKLDRLKTDAEKRAATAELDRFKKAQADETALQLSEDYDKGALLVFYFADQLEGVEDSGFDIASSMREMILSFDAAKESGRYAMYADARTRALAARDARRKNPGASVVAENPVTARLLEIQKTIEAKNYAQAGADLKALLDKNPDEPRIYYNIGRVSSLTAQSLTDESEAEKQKLLLMNAKVAFENVLRLAQKQRVDPALISLSYVSLGKIYEFYDDKTYAIGIYDAAIKVGDVAGGGYMEALAAKARLVKNQ
jgi:hypothetical protein